ncbi:MAG TPA: hypothetical protein VLF91_03425 [Candidatus Saccharimonadales bacterium]|nr:hypothetical protein [Candidatus Saccharimonadales bacterium]
MTLIQHIQTIYRLLADDRLESLGLFHIEDDRLVTPIAGNTLSLFAYRSKRADEMIPHGTIKRLIDAIQAGNGYTGINHIGFHYKTASKEDAVTAITKQASSKGYSVYQEPSIDDAAWIFVGNLSDVTNPLLEFLPHEGQTDDKWVDYYLPHIQFDINTGMTPQEIETVVKKFIRKPFTPYAIQIDGVTYIQRVNLGCVEGVNLMLDIATNNRDIHYRKSWAKLA